MSNNTVLHRVEALLQECVNLLKGPDGVVSAEEALGVEDESYLTMEQFIDDYMEMDSAIGDYEARVVFMDMCNSYPGQAAILHGREWCSLEVLRDESTLDFLTPNDTDVNVRLTGVTTVEQAFKKYPVKKPLETSIGSLGSPEVLVSCTSYQVAKRVLPSDYALALYGPKHERRAVAIALWNALIREVE